MALPAPGSPSCGPAGPLAGGIACLPLPLCLRPAALPYGQISGVWRQPCPGSALCAVVPPWALAQGGLMHPAPYGVPPAALRGRLGRLRPFAGSHRVSAVDLPLGVDFRG